MASDGIRRSRSTIASVHRELWTVEPEMLGADVTELQKAAARTLRVRGISRKQVPLAAHGKFTYATELACIEAQYFLGLASSTYLKRDAKWHRCCTIGAQRVIRGDVRRSPAQLARAKARRGQLARGPRYYDKLAAAHRRNANQGTGADAALRFAIAQIGTHETPAGANSDRGRGRFGSGPRIDQWIKLTGYTSPVPWCGCFTNACVVAAGVPNGAGWIGYVPSIVDYARAGRGGWKLVPASEGRRGDLACFVSGGEYVHVEIVERRRSASSYGCVGGNTTPAGMSGSQANGGAVGRTNRSTQGGFRIGCFARPPYNH